ncbi:MAG TPA: hypothetical protein VMG12_10495 [Polyangiaceae bacterium]|nr:hypothetical protein [Polyangiaceae bacterium]
MPRFIPIDLATGVSIEITRIEPAQPVEGTPITIHFNVTAFGADRSARVTSGVDSRVFVLKSSLTQSASIGGVAPKAGVSQPVSLQAYDHPTPLGVEFPAPIAASDPFLLDISAVYDFRIDAVRARVTRDNFLSGHGQHPKDYLVGSATALYGGTPLPDPGKASALDATEATQTEAYGWIESGSEVHPNMRFGPFAGVPGKAPAFTFSYLFARAANDQRLNDGKRALDAISAAGRDIAKALYPQLAGAWDGVHELHQLIHSAIFANCDGIVATDKKVAASADLAALTDNAVASEQQVETPNEVHQRALTMRRGRGTYSETRIYSGSTSPGPCGSDLSEYHVTFTFDRLSYPER